ncbi:MAG: gamma-glutamyltransferase family protein [Actinomycetota bacterium]
MRFDNAAICSPLTLASEIGLRFLRDGGNAVDAAIACNLALAVAYPHMCGVGGDLFAMVFADGELIGLNSSGALPAAARLPPDGVPERGIGAATVPGAPAGWTALAGRFGTIPLRDLAAPACELARNGMDRSPGLAGYTRLYRWLLRRDPDAHRIFLADRLEQEELAVTLENLEEFYEGEVAHRVPAPFAPSDLARHVPTWVDPLSEPFAGLTVHEMPPNSRGHLALEALRRLEPLDGLTPEDPAWHARLIRALDAARRDGDTVYVCVVDATGMAVSLNQSLYMAFGCGIVVPGTGVLLHNRAAYFSGEAYVPGAVPTHTLAPAMALRDGTPHLVFGTMGGEGQIQIHLQLLARVAIAGEPLEEAIAAPRWILRDGVLFVEDGLPSLEDVSDVPIRRVDDIPLERVDERDVAGHAHAIRVSPPRLEAAADPRSDGVEVGY